MRKALLAAAIALIPLAAMGQPNNAEPGTPKELPLVLTEIPKGAKPGDPHVHIVVEKEGNQYLVEFYGHILSGDAERFRQSLDLIPRPISKIVILGSPGGSLPDGLAIGRMIRQAKLATHIPNGVECASSCNFVFLGGVIRTIAIGGQFVTHMFHYDIAPKAMLIDMQEANKSDKPTGINPGTATSLTPLSDVVGKPGSTKHLEDLGCKYSDVFGDGYEAAVQRQEIALETGKDEGKVDLNTEQAKNTQQLNELRALTMDYLCLEQTTVQQAAEIAIFLLQMRLSERFLVEFSEISNASPIPLSRERLREYNIINME
jgi:hypothetical protein